ncbi:hypothetical protein [Nocardioides panacisoli]|uniref:CARDB domain-containing protein n=1 Tax=Nocardioides panacisoli TaxID=627624 RepID=A0ABP7IQJ5_9ACTN
MSPWSENKRPMWPIYTGMGVIIAGLVIGYLLMTGVVGAGSDAGSDRPTPGLVPPTGGSGGTVHPQQQQPLKVVSWGETSGQLAVVVRNDSDQPIKHLRVRISALDTAGDVVMSTTGTGRDVCCTVVGLPPGKYFGLFADIDPAVAGRTTAVQVRPAYATTPAKAGPEARITVTRTRLQRLPDDTVVTANLTTRGEDLSGYVAAQAFLVGKDGRVVQVISGRFYCFRPGTTHEIRLRLFHPVPDGVRLDRIVAYAIPDGVPPHVPGECR